MDGGIILGHHIYTSDIQVDPSQIAIISSLHPPQKQKYVRSFLRNTGYYRIFIKYSSKIVASMFSLLTKDVYFHWVTQC